MEEEPKMIDRLTKIASLGGKIGIKKELMGYYFGNSENMSKEKLFGKAGQGPLHPGMPYKHEIAAGASSSDTKTTLVRELVEQSSFTRREAEAVVEDMLRSGALVEIDDPNLGKVLVFKGRRDEH